ncbi:alpha/beta hydrolase family protein [Actinocorallia libanotica]|uniref:Alpha/beta hydrolase family protein n=1 Tax=Actinocorallia libanotica TaxID=46162 RepID=A0ABP4ANN7_9ACTN
MNPRHRLTPRRLGALALTGVLALSLMPASGAPAAAAPAFRKADNGSAITGYKWLTKNKRQLDVSVRSKGLGRTEKVRLLLPKGWKRNTKKTWPVVYLLHGGRAGYQSWYKSSTIKTLAAKWGVIVVMPEGRNGSYTNWFNHGNYGIPEWETFHMTEVFQLVQRNFHTSSRRAVIGNSSGGQGAITYAARYKGRFKYAASFSGVLSLLSPGVPQALREVNSGNADIEAIYGDPEANRDNWIAHDPFSLAGNLRGTQLYFTSGSGAPIPTDIAFFSEYIVGMTNGDFKKRLNALKISHRSHIYSGGTHAWPYWKRELKKAWPQAMKTLKAKKTT